MYFFINNNRDVSGIITVTGLQTAHTMKIWERIVDKRVRSEVEVAEEQFGFMPGRGTTNAIFILRQMAEKYREKGRKEYGVRRSGEGI